MTTYANPHPPDRPRKHTVVFAGGCHVVGFPVGADRGFPQVATSQFSEAGYAVEARAIGYIKINKPQKLIAAIHQEEPSVIVLQLGHFELLGGTSSNIDGASATGGSTKVDSRDSPLRSPVSKVLWAGRLVLKAIWQLLGNGISVDFATLSNDLRACLRAVRGSTQVPILLLSPFPCADPIVSYFRKRGIPVFESAAMDAGVDFIDLYQEQRLQRHGLAGHFDAIHLSEVGHHEVGAIVGEYLAKKIHHSS